MACLIRHYFFITTRKSKLLKTDSVARLFINGEIDMTTALSVSLYTSWMQAYAEAYAYHGDLDLNAKDFSRRLETILQKHLGPQPSASAATALFDRLYKNDLYLSAACAQQKQSAWERFLSLYRDYIQAIARFVTQTQDMANDLAGNLPGHLFLPDRSGCSRIASYDGQTALATWLRVIMTRQAINERERKASGHESLDELPDLVDEMTLQRIECDARAAKYAAMVRQVFEAAGGALSHHERLLILWKYREGLSSQEIAGLLAIHPSTVCRQLQEVYRKLARESATLLASQFHLSAAAVEECLEEARDGGDYSLLSAIEAV
jgi:RNA polymerase sigma-70 factor